MTVKELIEILKKYDGNMEILAGAETEKPLIDELGELYGLFHNNVSIKSYGERLMIAGVGKGQRTTIEIRVCPLSSANNTDGE